MISIVRTALENYNALSASVAFEGKYLSGDSVTQTNPNLELLEQRMAMIQCWLRLLNVDERFVVQKHLIEGLDWARVHYAFNEYWGGDFVRSERALAYYQASALKKICEFCEKYEDTTLHLFGVYDTNVSNDEAPAKDGE